MNTDKYTVGSGAMHSWVRLNLVTHGYGSTGAMLRRLELGEIDVVTVPSKEASDGCSLRVGRENRIDLGRAGPSVQLQVHLLEYLNAYLEPFLAGGQADVDHVDLEMDNGDYLIVACNRFKPPLDPESARRRLGL